MYSIVNEKDKILVTGASGFIGRRVVLNLLRKKFYNINCFIRSQDKRKAIEDFLLQNNELITNRISYIEGNLLSKEDRILHQRSSIKFMTILTRKILWYY